MKIISTRSKIGYSIFFLFTSGAAIISLINPIIDSFKSEDYLLGVFYLIFILFILVLGLILKPKKKKYSSLKKGIFRGVENITVKDAWPRPAIKNILVSAIQRFDNKPIILVGCSGTGKSVLLNTQVIPYLKEKNNWSSIKFDNYVEFKANFLNYLSEVFIDLSHDDFIKKSIISGIDESKKVLIVYD